MAGTSPTMTINAVETSSNREALVRRGMKHLLRRHLSHRQSLRMMVAQERLQDLAVGGEAVGPEIVAHQLARGLELLLDERQRAFRGRGVLELLHALGLGRIERLE